MNNHCVVSEKDHCKGFLHGHFRYQKGRGHGGKGGEKAMKRRVGSAQAEMHLQCSCEDGVRFFALAFEFSCTREGVDFGLDEVV